METTTRLRWTRWAPLLALTAILAACGAAVTPDPAATPSTEPDPSARATCVDSAIRLPDRGGGIHGAIVADMLHMGGATAPAACMEPANLSLLLPGLSAPDDRTAQVRQSQYYLIVVRYPGGNRLYVLSRRADGTSCVVDTNDQCIARVTDLPDDFNLQDLPDDVAPTIPAGRPAPPTVGPSPGDDEAPPAPGDDARPGTAPPPGGGYTPPVVGPPPGDGAPPAAAGTPPGAASTPQPSTGATGVTVGGPLLSWAAAPRALSYDVYWGAENTDLDTPINTAFTALRIAASADLDADTLYYWRVDAKNEAGTTRGAVWSFTTAAAPASPPAEETPPADETPPQPLQWIWPGPGAPGMTLCLASLSDNCAMIWPAPVGGPHRSIRLPRAGPAGTPVSYSMSPEIPGLALSEARYIYLDGTPRWGAVAGQSFHQTHVMTYSAERDGKTIRRTFEITFQVPRLYWRLYDDSRLTDMCGTTGKRRIEVGRIWSLLNGCAACDGTVLGQPYPSSRVRFSYNYTQRSGEPSIPTTFPRAGDGWTVLAPQIRAGSPDTIWVEVQVTSDDGWCSFSSSREDPGIQAYLVGPND